MSNPQLLVEIFPTVIAHIHERTVMSVGITPIEIAPTVAAQPADPDRAAHEIDPDGWHRANPTHALDCPYCTEAATDDEDGAR